MLERKFAIQYKYPDLRQSAFGQKNDFSVVCTSRNPYEETFEWYNTEIPKPTDEEIQVWYDEWLVIVNRKKEYPPIEDQLDTIFHQGIDVWKEQIQAVKIKYPKP
jgi:hypothetical protein